MSRGVDYTKRGGGGCSNSPHKAHFLSHPPPEPKRMPIAFYIILRSPLSPSPLPSDCSKLSCRYPTLRILAPQITIFLRILHHLQAGLPSSLPPSPLPPPHSLAPQPHYSFSPTLTTPPLSSLNHPNSILKPSRPPNPPFNLNYIDSSKIPLSKAESYMKAALGKRVSSS